MIPFNSKSPKNAQKMTNLDFPSHISQNLLTLYFSSMSQTTGIQLSGFSIQKTTDCVPGVAILIVHNFGKSYSMVLTLDFASEKCPRQPT